MLARFDSDEAALVKSGKAHYLATWADAQLLDGVFKTLLRDAGLPWQPVPANVRLRRRGAWTFAFNYGPDSWTVPDAKGKQFLLGDGEVRPNDLSIWR